MCNNLAKGKSQYEEIANDIAYGRKAVGMLVLAFRTEQDVIERLKFEEEIQGIPD